MLRMVESSVGIESGSEQRLGHAEISTIHNEVLSECRVKDHKL